MSDPPLSTQQSSNSGTIPSLKRKRDSDWGQAPKRSNTVGNAQDSPSTSPVHTPSIQVRNMGSGSEERGVKIRSVLAKGRDSETTHRTREDDRSPANYSNSGDKDSKDTRRRDRRSRSPSRNESSSRQRQLDFKAAKELERESRTRQAEVYKRSLKTRPDGESRSPQIQKIPGSGSSESRQSRDPRPIPDMDGADDRPALRIAISKPTNLPIIEQDTKDTMSDPRSKLKEALAHFLEEASEQASLQLRKDAAKKFLDRRITEYERSSKIQEEFPAAAEALDTAKKKAEQDLRDLDEEFIRKRQGSMVAIELISDCLFSQRTATSAPAQSQAVTEAQNPHQPFRASLKAIEEDLEINRTAVETELSSIRQDINSCVAQVSILAAEVQKRSAESVTLKAEIDSLSSGIKSIPDSRIELAKETERINGVLGAQANKIENLLKANQTGGLKFDGLKSAVTSLAKSENEAKGHVAKLQADLKDRDKAARTIDTRLNDIGARIGNLKKARSDTTAAQKVETFDGRVRRLENNLGKQVTQKLETIETRLIKLEDGSVEDTVVATKLDEFGSRVQLLESGQEKVDITRQTLRKVEESVQRTAESIQDIDKRLRGVEDGHFNGTLNRLKVLEHSLSNNGERKEMASRNIQNINEPAGSAQQVDVSVLTTKLDEIERGLRVEIRTTQDAGDEIVADYLREFDDRIKILEGSKLEDRLKVLEMEGTKRSESTAEQTNFLSRFESLERAYTAFSGQARHEMNRISSDLMRVAEETNQLASARSLQSSSLPPQVTNELVRISLEIQNLRNDITRLKICAGPLTIRAQQADERMNHLQNDVEGLKTGISNLDFRMSNLSTADLARQILEHLDAHRRSADASITTVTLRVQEIDEYLKRNEGEKHAELAKITEKLREELTQQYKKGTEQTTETSMQKFKEAAEQIISKAEQRLLATQAEVKKSNESLNSLREDLDSTKATFTEARDSHKIEVSNIKTAMTVAQTEISGVKDGLAILKEDLEGFSAQLQMQGESRVPEKLKVDLNITPVKKVNGHGPANKKRKVSAKQDSLADSDTDYRSAAS